MRRITYWLAILLIFIIPWEDSIAIESLGSLARLTGLIVAAFWAATIMVEGRFRKPNHFHLLVLIFFLWNCVSIFWSPDTASTLQRIKTYAQIFLLLLIYWEVFPKKENLIAGLQAYIFGAYVLIGSTIYNYITGTVSVEYEERYSATGVNAVDLSLILLIGLPIAIHLFFSAGQNKKQAILKLINLIFIPSAIFSIILTGSRTSLVAIIPFVIYLIVTQQIKLDRKVFIFGTLIVSFLVLSPFVPTSIISRLSSLGSSIEAGDLGGRVDLWRQSFVVLSKHSVLGLGSGTLVSTIGSAAHNTFVSVAAETGLIGFILFCSILAAVFFQALNVPDKNSGIWITIFLTWIIGVSSLSWEFRKLTWLFLDFIVIQRNLTLEALNFQRSSTDISKITNSFANNPEIRTKAS